MTEENKPKYEQVKLTESELEEAKLNLVKAERDIENSELNLKHIKKDEEEKLSERMSVLAARKNLADTKDKIASQLETTKLNKKVYEKQVETGMREEPVYEADEEEEYELEEPQEESDE